MKHSLFIKLIGAATLGLCVVGSVNAAPGDCATEFTGVTDAIGVAVFMGRGADQANLENKVTQGGAKVNLDKCDGALDKLADIDMKVMDLSDDVGKQKLSPEHAAAIMGETSIAAQCIGEITTCK